jgi:integrase
MKLQQLSRELFERYVAWRRAGNGAFPEKMKNGEKTAKAKTVNTELDMLASMLNKAVDWRYLARNPAKAISRLKEDDRKPFRFFSEEEIELLRLVADLLDAGASEETIGETVGRFHAEHRNLTLVEPPSSKRRKTRAESSEEENEPSPEDLREGRLRNLRLIVDFLLTTGARKDEVLGLEWSWLDLKRGLVSFRHRANWVPKGGERDVGLKPAVVEKLREWHTESAHPRVFLDWSGKPIPKRTFERGIQRLIRHARIPRATPHDFRHTFASHLAMAGVPLPTIQQLLGHQDIQTVMIYAHLSPGHVRQSVEALPF